MFSQWGTGAPFHEVFLGADIQVKTLSTNEQKGRNRFMNNGKLPSLLKIYFQHLYEIENVFNQRSANTRTCSLTNGCTQGLQSQKYSKNLNLHNIQEHLKTDIDAGDEHITKK